MQSTLYMQQGNLDGGSDLYLPSAAKIDLLSAKAS